MTLTPERTLSSEKIHSRLLGLAAVFMILYTLSVSLSPALHQQPANMRPWLVLAVWLVSALAIQRQLHLPRFREALTGLDPFLIPPALLLSGWGLLEITRLSPDFGVRQAAWLGLAVLVFCLGLHLPSDLNFLRRYKYLWLTGGLALTGLTLVFGTNPLGAGPRLWLGCCGLYLQPAEPLKLLLMVYLAAYLADRQYLIPEKSLSGPHSLGGLSNRLAYLAPLLAPTVVMAGLALALLAAQRDLGTALIFLFLYAAMVYLASGNVVILWASAGVIALAGLAGYTMFDVVRLRVDSWISPWADPSGRSFQIIQSLMAIASGGLFGRGPGSGSPGLVPVAHSDFIFSAIAEETGLLGALGLLVLVGLLAQRCLRLALQSTDTFSRLLAAGLGAYLAGQSIVIVGGNLRLLPLTGVTLPFISYGGSSLLISWLALLLLVLINLAPRASAAPRQATRAYFQLTWLLAAGLACSALLAGWWVIYRAPDLLNRTDNARRSIADRYARRGPILDRENQVIQETTGETGSYTRRNLYSPLAPVVGYTSVTYGQAGLEKSLDPYLRGLEGIPSSAVAWSQLLYGAPPPGLAVRLSIDLQMQHALDQALGRENGAGILLNAESGEILAMASHPYFDPNQLDQDWEKLRVDPEAPLLNRAVQGLYPVGAALSPLLLAAASSQSLGKPPTVSTNWLYGTQPLRCTQSVVQASGWASLVNAGCPDAAARLGELLGGNVLLSLFQQFGLYTAPGVRLQAASGAEPAVFSDARRAALGLAAPGSPGQPALTISPLQFALAMSALSNGGRLPAPRLALAYQSGGATWNLFAFNQAARQVLPKSLAQSTADSLADPALPIWLSQASIPALGPTGEVDSAGLTWLAAGTLPSWQGAPLTLVLLLERDDPELALGMGRRVFEQVLVTAP